VATAEAQRAIEEHSFLFADLVGFTALADLEGDERAADVALALERRIEPLLAGYDAEQVKALGDGVLLRCGRPGQAVELGLRIVEELERMPGFPPVRVAVHTGTAVSRGGDWYGRAVNVAARLCAVAGGGEVLVSEATREAAGRLRGVDFGERRMHWLRNVTQPVSAHLASSRRCPLSASAFFLRPAWRRRPATTRHQLA
jgi:adenylate cyclase